MSQIIKTATDNTWECVNPAEHMWDEEAIDIMLFDLHQLKKCQLVIVGANDPSSLGTMAEIATAYENNIPVFILNPDNNELHPWIRYMSIREFQQVNELVDYLLAHYLRYK